MTETAKGSEVLWCCHVRGPDDVHAAPDYATALKWADICLETDRRVDHTDPFVPFLSAVPAPWPNSAEAHAADLPKSIEYFALPAAENGVAGFNEGRAPCVNA